MAAAYVETALDATKKGRVAAQFVPEGLYNGANATAIRRELFTAFRLEHLAGFENTKGIWFDKIDTRMKFCLYVAWKGGNTEHFNGAFRVNSTQKLAVFVGGGGLCIPVSVVEEFSPDSLAVMEFSSQKEIDVCSKMYKSLPKFGSEIENQPYRRYMREIDMGTDRGLFESEPGGFPLFEGRMVDFFDYRAKAYVSGRGRAAEWVDLPFGSEAKEIRPQWYISKDRLPEKLTEQVELYRIGYCNVTSPTNSRSFIACLIPPNTVCGHSVPTISSSNKSVATTLLWLAVLNSFSIDFLVRKKVALNMVHTITDSLPLPRNWTEKACYEEIIHLTYRLVGVGSEMSDLAKRLAQEGIDVSNFPPCEDIFERDLLRAKIDVIVAREVLSLNRNELKEIIDPVDPEASGFKALKSAEVANFGCFRTLSLILEEWGNE